MELKKLKRLDFLIANVVKRRRETWDMIQMQKLNEFERSYMEAVMWISITTEWFEKNAPKILYTSKCDLPTNLFKKKRIHLTDEYFYLLGVKQIFNSLKHNVQITKYDETIYEEFIQDIHIQRIIWIHSREMDFQNKIHHENSFKENFKNREIISTLFEAETKLCSLRTLLNNSLKVAQTK